MRARLQRLGRVLLAVEDALLTVALAATLLLAISQILLRNFWHTD